MDHYLRGIDNGVEKASAVRYFVMGKNEWRDAESWPPPGKLTPYYLTVSKDSARRLATDKPQSDDPEASFVSDPANPVKNIYSSSGAHDYGDLAARADVLTFDSVPLDSDTEVTGFIQAKIFVSCECRDADLWVRLLDVAADGTAFNLMSPGLDVQRLSYREPEHGRQLLQPGEIYEIKLDHLVTSNVFLKGHKIRLQISGTFFPNFSRNPQNGDLEATSSVLQEARISVYTDRRHPSQVLLPVR
jgi:putative CocE/NonD family hydrolase